MEPLECKDSIEPLVSKESPESPKAVENLIISAYNVSLSPKRMSSSSRDISFTKKEVDLAFEGNSSPKRKTKNPDALGTIKMPRMMKVR